MGLASKFNEVAAEYDKWRPVYVAQLYEAIFACKRIDESSTVLEIGIGTGQATWPVVQTNCRLIAVEPGDNLAAFTKEKFVAYKNLEVQNVTFEDFEYPESSFDLIYSATAFHWIPEAVGYEKVYRLLKSGGVFARFSNRPGRDKQNEQLHMALQQAYAKYMPDSPEPPEFGEDDCRELSDTAKKYGFTDISCKLFHRPRTFDAESYVSLLNTYSDHRALSEEQRSLLFEEIKDVINRFGGRINIFDTIDLQLARKP